MLAYVANRTSGTVEVLDISRVGSPRRLRTERLQQETATGHVPAAVTASEPPGKPRTFDHISAFQTDPERELMCFTDSNGFWIASYRDLEKERKRIVETEALYAP